MERNDCPICRGATWSRGSESRQDACSPSTGVSEARWKLNPLPYSFTGITTTRNDACGEHAAAEQGDIGTMCPCCCGERAKECTHTFMGGIW